MKIAVDIDGVLTNVEQFQFNYGSRFFMSKYDKTIKNPNAYSLSDMFNANEHQELEFWEENLENYDTKEPARAFASDVIDELKTLGHEIIIMTARCGDFDYNEEKNNHMKQITKNWLLKNNISYDEIIFTPKEKLELCIENKIDLMIEDKASHVMKISKIMPVLCFDAKYNQECFGENIIRVYSWYDVLSKIKSNNLNEPSYKIK